MEADVSYVTREQWGAKPPKWTTVLNGSQGVFIHYNGGPVPSAVLAGEHVDVCSFLRSSHGDHRETQGWPDIAYSWAVSSTGVRYELRGWGVVGAHTMNWNERSHAIFLPLGGDQAPTEAQIVAARQIVSEHNRLYGKGFVKGHQQAPNPTSCPGPQVMARMAEFDPDYQQPAGEEEEVKPVMMRRAKDGTISVFYGNGFRYDCKPPDIDKFKFLGVPYLGDADPWFWQTTQPLKAG